MENIIDKNYMWGQLSLSNMSEEEELNELDRYIAKYQKEYLTRMFGKTIAADMPEGLIELLYDHETLTSPIANFVFFYLQRDKASFTTPAGEKTLMIDKTRAVLPTGKLVRAWNEMSEFNAKLHVELYLKEIEIDGIDYEVDIRPFVKFTDDIFMEINIFNA